MSLSLSSVGVSFSITVKFINDQPNWRWTPPALTYLLAYGGGKTLVKDSRCYQKRPLTKHQSMYQNPTESFRISLNPSKSSRIFQNPIGSTLSPLTGFSPTIFLQIHMYINNGSSSNLLLDNNLLKQCFYSLHRRPHSSHIKPIYILALTM